jgi:hypothetical protein
MDVVDLTEPFRAIVTGARGTIELRARFWPWLDEQRRSGPLAPLLDDMERHWSVVGEAPGLDDARALLRHLEPGGHAARARAIGERFRAVSGVLPAVTVVLLAGLRRPEGYSRFDRGRNTIFLGLDHPNALAHADHFELILAHELCHAVRDPDPGVLGDYGGEPAMTHDDFVARHPLREHIVSEGLATAVSELAYPGRPDRRYVYFDEAAIAWCEAHRREITERMLRALEREEPYRTFYAPGSVAPDSPECCDYWFGLHLARFALAQAAAGELLRLPSNAFLARFLEPFARAFADRAPAPAPAGEAMPLAGASLPAAVRDAYAEYAALLARPGLARALDAQVAGAVARARLDDAGRPWQVHAFPILVSADEERYLQWAADGLLRLIEQIIERYRQDSDVRAFFALPQPVEELCLLEPGYRPHVMLGRFDAHWSGRRARFLELNANGAALWCLADALAEAALDLPQVGDLLRAHGAQPRALVGRMLDGLLSAWQQSRGPREPRRIAIVDWADLPTSSEHRRLATQFTALGIPADHLAPAALAFDGRELRGPNGPIDIVYRRLTTIDLIERHAELGALLGAARAGAVVTVASFASDVAHSKRLFAFLTHERWQRSLSPAERALVDAHVPWTRMFVPGRTQYEGRLCELDQLALAARERFVLKPAEGYEGRGVLLGAQTEPAQWAVEVAHRFGGAHVIQEAVQAPLRRLLVPRGERTEEVARWLHLGQFVIGGRLAGLLARASQELVLSPESTERALPCLVLGDGAGALPDAP